MAAVVIDTHTAVWYLSNDPKLSENAQRALDDAAATGDPTYLCAISVVEVVYSMLTPPLEAGTKLWGFQRGRASPLVKGGVKSPPAKWLRLIDRER